MEQGEVSQRPPAAVVELLGRDGRVQWVQRVQAWPLTLGRSPACDIVLDDPHLAAEHAELHWAEDGARLRLRPTHNGARVAGQALATGEERALLPDGEFLLAGNLLRLRTAADALAPERPLVVQRQRHWALLPGLVVLLLVLQWLDRWTVADPDARWIDYAAPLLGPLGFVLAWAGLWSLASQLFQHRFPFATHLRRALLVLCALDLLDWLVPGLAYAFSWPRLIALQSLALPVGGALLVAWHAHLVWPGARRILDGGIVALLLLGLGLQWGSRQEQQYAFGAPYLASLPPPALRLATPRPPQELIDSLQPLKTQLARQARKDNEGASEEDAGE